MIHAILSLPTVLGCFVFMALTSVLGLAVYLASFRLLAKNCRDDEVKETKEATGNLFRVVGWLFSLLLSLTFAEVFRTWVAIDTAIEGEATTIMDTFEDLRRFGLEDTRDIRKLLIDYTRAVIDDDWPALADDELGPRADEMLRQLNDAVFTLEPNDANREALRSRIVSDVDLVSDFRLSRLQQAQEKPPFILVVVLLGYVITMVCFGVYRPCRNVVFLLSLFTLFIGVVIYLILSMSDPFQGSLSVNPAALEYVLERMQGHGG
jgi:hypothetical protein